MMLVPDFLGNDPLSTADALDALACDLRLLAEGHSPTDEQLAKAPLLRQWGFVQRPRPALFGNVFGHPLIIEGNKSVTSEIFAIDQERRWVRTLSRLYALGPATRFGLPG